MPGRVVGPDGEPLKGVRITISGSDHVITTASDGKFAITNLSPAHYDVTAALEGYESVRRRFVVEAGKVTPVALKLAPNPRR